MPIGSEITQLLLRQGDIAANRAQQTGQVWGQALSNIGNTVSQLPAQMQQRQQEQQTTELRGLQLQQAQREAKSIKSFETAMSDPANVTPDGSLDENKVASYLKKNDVGAYEHYVDLSTKQAQAKLNYTKTVQEINASNVSMQEKQRAMAQAQQEQLGRYAYSGQQMIAAKPNDLVHARDTTLALAAHAVGDGLVNADQAKQFVMQTASSSPDQLSQTFGQFVPPDLRAKFDAEKATTAKAAAEADKASADAALARSKAQPPDMARYQSQIDAIIPPTDKANADLRRSTIARVTTARTVEDAEKAIDEASKQVGQINVAKNTVPYKIEVGMGGVNYAPNAQGEPNPTAKAIAEYRMPPLSSFALARPAGQMLMQEVTRMNPSYDATQFPLRQKVRNAYTTGTEGQQLNAMNTAIMHMDLLADAADALKNGDFKPGNAVYNKIKDMFGSAEPNSYATIKEFLDGEVGAVIKKGVATEGEMGRLESKGGASASPEQLQAYIKNAVRILGGKSAVLDDKYHSVMGPTDPFTALSPRSQAVLVKHGFNPLEFGSQQANGPTPAQQVPDLTGLTAGHGRTFSSGPFSGQTWTLGTNGPELVKKKK